ncbi:tetratricopeptide repeat protein [Pseudomonas sp. K2I15]|uniref:tetratricopeptide repeat protein n=1 Tax=unclassified Pseudomonas TaxID=196821 RepID=UPI000B4CF6DF|nr:hypothetical protein [Pseudomonas sp. K2I15]OWP69982.1 hypothetical protein CEC48_20515 [Pseudomonas sp. K2I15]
MKSDVFLFALFWFSVSVCAEGKIYSLSPSYYDLDMVEFVSLDGDRGRTIKGYLADKNGRRYSIPDMCEPEGGDAELIDSYTVKGKDSYFLFTCGWSVQHFGIGLNGAQYETFVYVRRGQDLLVKEDELSRILSGYEGRQEGGGSSYVWYSSAGKIASEKILGIESGKLFDSLVLAHKIVISRLSNGDMEAIKVYLSFDRVQQLFQDFPVSKSTAAAYNDFGYALGEAGENVRAYEILKEVEKASPDRVVLKLNIADVLWGSDKNKSKEYYKKYLDLMRGAGKERLVPLKVFERIDYN